MKQIKTLAFCVILFIQFSSFGQNKLRTDPLCYTGSFMKVVKRNDAKLTIKHLDRRYKKVQLKKFLKNNKEQFLNELFSGQDTLRQEFVSIEFLTIDDISLIEIIDNGANNWIVYFLITTSNENIVKSELRLVLSKRFFRKRLGFVGSFG